MRRLILIIATLLLAGCSSTKLVSYRGPGHSADFHPREFLSPPPISRPQDGSRLRPGSPRLYAAKDLMRPQAFSSQGWDSLDA